MLESTFCHIPRVSPRTERRLWDTGVLSWQDIPSSATVTLSRVRWDDVQSHIDESYRQLRADNPHFFAATLPSALHWRLFPEFRHRLAYLDIETTGLAPPQDKITTIALYDGRDVRCYVRGQNLAQAGYFLPHSG